MNTKIFTAANAATQKKAREILISFLIIKHVF